jgi:PadR family transcriptional regulator, regulatory protein AphA
MILTDMQEIELTPTSFIVLGLLAQAGEATPYRLKQVVDASVGHFWSLHRSQLHAEPARLARAGYLSERQEPDGRRRKRYALTERGQEALARWVATPTDQFTELRDLAFLKLFFGADPSAQANAQLAVLRPLLETYEAMLDATTSDGRAASNGPLGPLQTLQAGIDQTRTAILTWERIAGEGRTTSP